MYTRLADSLDSYPIQAERSKKCNRCRITKPYSGFWKSAKNKTTGLHSECRACSRERHVEWELKNAARENLILPVAKQCYRCRETKVRADFTISRRSFDGLDKMCTACKSVYIKRYAGTRHRRKHTLWQHHGITVDEYNAMLTAQNGCCAICAEPFPLDHPTKRPCVDHCHTTGRIRGVLCPRCNGLLGAIERPGFMDAALAYLDRTKDFDARGMVT